MIGSFTKLSLRHRWVSLVLWAVLVLATLPLASQVTKNLTANGFDRPHSQVHWANSSLNQLHPPPAPQPLLLQHMSESSVVQIGRGVVPRSSLHHISRDKTLFIPPQGLAVRQATHFQRLIQQHHGTVSQVSQGAIGNLVTHDASKTLAESGVVALPVLAILLLMVFGSVAAMSLPLIIALAGSEVALAAVSIISRYMQLSVFLTDIVSFLALGVGVDYALFISTRFRQNLDQGMERDEAVVDSMAHAGRSVLYSGIAVGLAVATLLFGGNAYWHGLAIGGAVAIFSVLLATHTLLPSVMSLFGTRLHWGRIRRPDFHVWRRLAHWVTHHPVWSVVVALAILIPFTTAAPQIQMNSPANLATMLPRSDALRLAVQKQQQVQGSGSIAPIAVVAELPHPLNSLSAWQTVSSLTSHLQKLPNVASVASPTLMGVPLQVLAGAVSQPKDAPAALSKALKNFLSPTNPRLVVLFVTAKTGPNDGRTSTLVGRIDSHLKSWLPSGSRASAGGLVPALRSFNILTQSRIPWIIASALAVALVVLSVATRSFMQAVLGVIFDALVALATAGFMVFVDHHQLFGFERQPLDSSITPLIFVLLFGLSMDYEVILLHRIQEQMAKDKSMKDAVRHGVATTGAMITGAGMIMVVVFLALLISPLQVMKTIAIGLSFAVLADTWIVRSLLVPSTTVLLNRYGFWPWRPRAQEVAAE